MCRPWSLPANREAAIKYFKLKRAREEIIRCNVEAGRLQAWINFKNSFIPSRVQQLSLENPLLSSHILTVHRRQRRLNDQNQRWLLQLYHTIGYSGPLPPTGLGLDVEAVNITGGGEDDIEDDKEFADEMTRVTDVIERATLE